MEFTEPHIQRRKEIKRPGREADHHKRSSAKMQDEPAVTAFLYVLTLYAGTVVPSHAVNKGDVRYSSALK
jgi:hypothetical protein